MAKAWDFIVDAMVAADVIDLVDAGVLEAAATFWGRAQQARRELAVEMRTSKSLLEQTPQGRIPNRLLTVERDSWREFRALAESLPLSPWGRARLGLKSKTAGAGSEVEIGLPPRLLHASGE
jgi:phage terminase small subunit